MASETEARRRGNAAELAVASYLESRGLVLLAHQYAVPRLGEIDLIMQRDDVLYFIEVKARSDLVHFGGGLASITAAKCRKLRRTALHYSQKQGLMNMYSRFLAAEVELIDGMPQGKITVVPIDQDC